MVALNFMDVFAEDVATGKKLRSIRAPRKDKRPNAVPGQMLQLYNRMRHPTCRKLRPDTPCVRIRPVAILPSSVVLGGRILWKGEARDYLVHNGPADFYLENFARADGFDSFAKMADYFDKTHGLPFSGFLIEW